MDLHYCNRFAITINTKALMRRLLVYTLYWVFRFTLGLRYRVTIRGIDEVEQAIKGKGGVLFLANHPAMIDPPLVLRFLWLRFHFRIVAADFLFQNPILRYLLNSIHALPVPDFEASANSYKQKKIYSTLDQVIDRLNRGEHVLIYPAGGIKSTGLEAIKGRSGTQKIVQRCPSIPIVLIRTTGLWGSMFSRALTGTSPPIPGIFFEGLKILLKNALFFAPRRKVTIELKVAEDFPSTGQRQEINSYLEDCFNQGKEEPLTLVPHYFWSSTLPSFYHSVEEKEVDLSNIDPQIREEVIAEIQTLASEVQKEIIESTHLAKDLGLDSLDIAQLIFFLKEKYGITTLHPLDLTTVGSAIAFAAKRMTSTKEESGDLNPKVDLLNKNRPLPGYPPGDTIQEVFLRSTQRMGSSIACEDSVTGPLSYARLLLAVIILSFHLKKLPQSRLGIMLPASVGANTVILAALLANKTPVMINWTLGPRNLASVVTETGITQVITSWKFLNRLENIDFGVLDDDFLFVDEIKRSISLWDKMKGKLCSLLPPSWILKLLRVNPDPEATAVILFTSGTESVPKGVPLSHRNILSNQRAAYACIDSLKNDIFLGVLPPFHSFGFSATGLLPLLLGVPVVFSPSPLDGKAIAKAIEQAKVTIICLAPSFLKNLIRVASSDQLSSLRLIVTGAEKLSEDLKQSAREIAPNARCIEGYGITECSPILTLNPILQPKEGVGLPLHNVEIKIVDQEQYDRSAAIGMILASGPNIFSGYLNPLLPSPFVMMEGKRWYITGDLGYCDEEGHLYISGRLKRFVKIAGEMVSLNSIEEALLNIGKRKGWKMEEEVPTFAVQAIEKEGEKTRILLFTTASLTLEEVNQELKKEGFSNLIRISGIHRVKYIPLLGTGKINYKALHCDSGI